MKTFPQQNIPINFNNTNTQFPKQRIPSYLSSNERPYSQTPIITNSYKTSNSPQITRQTPNRFQPTTTQNIQSPQIRSSKQVMEEFHELLSQTNTLYEQFNSLEKQIKPSPSQPQQLLYGSHHTSHHNSINLNNNNNNVLFYETNDISNIRQSPVVNRMTRGQSGNNIYEPLNNVNFDLGDDMDVIGSSPLDDNKVLDDDEVNGNINTNEDVLLDNADSNNNSSINLDDIANEIQDYYNNTDYQAQQAKRIEEDIAKLKIANQVLMRSNVDLRNENKLLENEIATYKTSGLVDKHKMNNNKNVTEYDVSLNAFLDNLKNSLSVNLEKNLYLMEQINELILQNQKLFEENMRLDNNYGNMVNQYEFSNKRNV